MRVKSKLGLRLAAVGVVVGAAGLPLVGATAAHAAGPALTATPPSGLVNGDTTTIAGTGFGASSTAYLVECSGLTGQAACDTSTLVTKATDASGDFSVSFTVEEGTVGTGDSAGPCYGGDTCYVAVTTDPTHPSDTAQASATPITFAAATSPTAYVTPSTGLKSNQVLRVVGVGFTDSNPYSIVECSSLAADGSGCSKTATSGTLDASGNFTTSFTAKTGAIGKGTCAAGSTNCVLIVDGDPLTPSDTSELSIVPLTFAKATTASGASITVTPSTGLKNQESVTIKGKGFPKKAETAYIVECSSLAGTSACGQSVVGSAQTTKTGTFSAKFKVYTGKVGSGKCVATKSCYLVATTDITGKDKSQIGEAKITFGKAVKYIKVTPKVAAHVTKTGVAGKVTVKGKGFKGLKLVLVRVKGQSASIVKHAKSGKHGKYSFKESKAGKYVVGTVLKKAGKIEFVVATSKKVTIK